VIGNQIAKQPIHIRSGADDIGAAMIIRRGCEGFTLSFGYLFELPQSFLEIIKSKRR
jgi:hypothetical protein